MSMFSFDEMDFSEESAYENYFANEQEDRCGVRKYKPKPNESLGFKNYFKMFMCRFPNLNKCLAQRKAKCAYDNLSERSKQRYRDLGEGFKCCVRRKAMPAKKVCKKPKRKAKKCPKPCPANCMEVDSITELVNMLLDYIKSKGVQDHWRSHV